MNLIAQLKENEQDFQWYPTTDKIIEVLHKNIDSSHSSILDIGAGNGKVLSKLNELNKEGEFECYAIEKSQILINQLPANVFVIGTDFHRQTLIDKKVDVVFCNPPYSEYEQWTCRIIEQANCKQIFLVIPERWKQNKRIMHAIKDRYWTYKTLGSFDFLNAERQARAKVNLIMFEKVEHFNSIYDDEKRPETKDPFEYWFDTNFKITAKKDKFQDFKQETKQREKLKNEIVKGQSLIPRLEELCNLDMQKLLNNYKSLENLDSDILKELNVNLDGLKEGLKLKIEGLKNLYWQELFDNLDKITERLTSDSRKKMLATLTAHTSVDFTCENAYAVVIWVIKNANKYFNSQLLEMYLKLADRENIRNYKSNKKLIEDGWRYEKEKHSHYSLDYRLVTCHYGIWGGYSFNRYEFDEKGKSFIDDIITIAKNLGYTFASFQNAQYYDFKPSKKVEITAYKNKTIVFMEARAYKNSNIHIKFNKEFMQAFNIEAGRLNGWLKDPKHASDELDIPIEETQKYFKTNFTLLKNDVKLLENLQSSTGASDE